MGQWSPPYIVDVKEQPVVINGKEIKLKDFASTLLVDEDETLPPISANLKLPPNSPVLDVSNFKLYDANYKNLSTKMNITAKETRLEELLKAKKSLEDQITLKEIQNKKVVSANSSKFSGAVASVASAIAPENYTLEETINEIVELENDIEEIAATNKNLKLGFTFGQPTAIDGVVITRYMCNVQVVNGYYYEEELDESSGNVTITKKLKADNVIVDAGMNMKDPDDSNKSIRIDDINLETKKVSCS